MAAIICPFPSNQTPAISEVGGKGYALIQLSRFMPVPPGIVLATGFFEAWWQELSGTSEWRQFVDGADAELPALSTQLKTHAMLLSFTEAQSDAISEALQRFPADELFAVRSSSPEEDLEGTSFAGAYETVLGVTRKSIQAAVRACFASCIDYRVIVYKRQKGFDLRSPKIAVVIQKQIASDVSGVAFSLNPVSNDFDEAVINANFGLGETVVAGDVIPDTFVIDKLKLAIKYRHIGSKERSMWLTPNGGTNRRDAKPAEASRLSLSDSQVVELTRLVNAVESRNGKPMDIEWAFESGKLYLLQARPVTGYQPLPPDLVTTPARERRLYLDVTRSVQGIERPLSEMGASIIKLFIGRASMRMFDTDVSDHIDRTVLYVTAGRLYANVSNALCFLEKDKLVAKLMWVDPLAAKAIVALDETDYKSSDDSIKSLPLLAIKRLPELASYFLRARVQPEALLNETLRELELYKQQLLFLKRTKLKLRDFANRVFGVTAQLAVPRLLVLVIVGLTARAKIGKLAGESMSAEVEKMTKSLPGNVTVEMGLALYDLSQHLPEGINPSELSVRLKERNLPADFLLAWDSFMSKYGHRAAEEFDIATRRYREDNAFLLNQLFSLSALRDSDSNPRAKYESAVRERELAFARMQESFAGRSRMSSIRLDSAYRVMTSFLGLRETPKFCLMLAIDAIKQRIVEAAAHLVSKGQLDSVDQVWEISFDQLCAALDGTTVDLRAVVSANRARRERLRLNSLPKIFDSRGRIVRAPVAVTKANEILGTPISPGSAIGVARVLHRPDEKSLQAGDILVARATDPGWTPLFATASAVVLEVGGMLQHGALVAREYGLPCVAGIQNVTQLLKDGARIEVDGTNGIVRILDTVSLSLPGVDEVQRQT